MRHLLLFALCSTALAGPLVGHVVDRQSRTPLASAQVRIRKPGAAILLADLDTDSNGQFHCPELPAGDYQIEASKPNYIATNLRVHIGGPNANALTVALIRYGVIGGQVLDQQGQPVTGARVIAIPDAPEGPSYNRFSTAGQNEAITDDRGRFRLFRLAPGRYSLAVSYELAGNGLGSNFLFLMENSRPRIFEITSGDEFRDIGFTLLPASFWRISGTVLQPKPGATFGVTLIARDRPLVSIAQVRTESDGKFHFEGIPPGAYDLVAAGPVKGWGARTVWVDPGALFGRVSIDVSGQNIEDLTLPVTEGRSASLVLRFAAAGCPETAQARLTPLDDNGVGPPDPVDLTLKRPHTIADLAPGRYRAEITNAGGECYQTAPAMFDVSAGSLTEPVPLVIDAAGSIAGKLTGAANPSEFEISLIDIPGDASPVRLVFPDSESRFTFPTLRPGLYRITVRPVSGPVRERIVELTVSGGAPTTVEIPAPGK